MRVIRAAPDLSSEIWKAGLEETERLRRKAERPPLPEGKTKKECRRDTLAKLERLSRVPPKTVAIGLLKARCFRCGRCDLAPRDI